jgi:hypothetical protein
VAHVEPLAPDRDRGGRDDGGERVEQQREQRGVDAVERGEVAAGLERVAARAEREAESEVAGLERADLAGRAAGEEEEPEEPGRHDEPEGEQGADARALVVGELAEDRHRAERGGGGDAEEGAFE